MDLPPLQSGVPCIPPFPNCGFVRTVARVCHQRIRQSTSDSGNADIWDHCDCTRECGARTQKALAESLPSHLNNRNHCTTLGTIWVQFYSQPPEPLSLLGF